MHLKHKKLTLTLLVLLLLLVINIRNKCYYSAISQNTLRSLNDVRISCHEMERANSYNPGILLGAKE